MHFNRVFHYFHHSFWGKTPYFWKKTDLWKCYGCSSPPPPFHGSKSESWTEIRRDRRLIPSQVLTGSEVNKLSIFIISMSSFLEYYVQVNWMSWSDMNWTNDIRYKRTNEIKWIQMIQRRWRVCPGASTPLCPWIKGTIHITRARQMFVAWLLAQWLHWWQDRMTGISPYTLSTKHGRLTTALDRPSAGVPHSLACESSVCEATKNDWLTQCLLPFSCGIVWFVLIHGPFKLQKHRVTNSRWSQRRYTSWKRGTSVSILRWRYRRPPLHEDEQWDHSWHPIKHGEKLV